MKTPRASAKSPAKQPSLRDWPDIVVGGKYVRLLERHVKKLRDEDPHGNRKLFLDDVFILSLLAFHNPTLRSLRTFEDFSQTRQAQKHLSLIRVCKSTLADFHKLADPARLEPILQALREELTLKGVTLDQKSDLDGLFQRTIAVDGTFLPALADVAWAVASCNQHTTSARYRARIDCQLNVASFVPEMFVVPDPGESECTSASRQVQAGKLYVYDRGFSGYALINAHYEEEKKGTWREKAQFVIRYKPAGSNSPELQAATEQTLTDKDREAGVFSDRVGEFHSSNSARHPVAAVRLREVLIETQENGQPSQLRLITNLLDVPAETIGRLYQQRWQIELFFRWLKTVGNFNHLISHCREGLLTQLYVTLIGVLLMYLHTGYRPSRYLFALLGAGADLEDLLPILQERERQCEVARKSARARREAAKKRAQ